MCTLRSETPNAHQVHGGLVASTKVSISGISDARRGMMLVEEKIPIGLAMKTVMTGMRESPAITMISLTSDQRATLLIAMVILYDHHKKLHGRTSDQQAIMLGGSLVRMGC